MVFVIASAYLLFFFCTCSFSAHISCQKNSRSVGYLELNIRQPNICANAAGRDKLYVMDLLTSSQHKYFPLLFPVVICSKTNYFSATFFLLPPALVLFEIGVLRSATRKGIEDSFCLLAFTLLSARLFCVGGWLVH